MLFRSLARFLELPEDTVNAPTVDGVFCHITLRKLSSYQGGDGKAEPCGDWDTGFLVDDSPNVCKDVAENCVFPIWIDYHPWNRGPLFSYNHYLCEHAGVEFGGFEDLPSAVDQIIKWKQEGVLAKAFEWTKLNSVRPGFKKIFGGPAPW